MYIQSLEIENLRTFEKAKVVFNLPDAALSGGQKVPLPNVNLVLGDNGAGKTTVLRAVALAALAPLLASSSGFVPYSLVRRLNHREMGPARVKADLILHLQDGTPGPVTIEAVLHPTRGWNDRFESSASPPWAEGLWEDQSASFLMVGYGAGRRVNPDAEFSQESRAKSRALRYSRVAGLFEEAVTMVPLSTWLPRFHRENPGRHKQVVNLMNQLLAPNVKLFPEPLDEQYLFQVGGAALPFQALSDGYRAYVGWIADLLYHVCMGAPTGKKLSENQGIVLIDEVDLHLHPAWQQRVIPTLAAALPNLQFVLTSHSPLVVGSLHRNNVFVLEGAEVEGVRRSLLRPSDEEVYGLSADQILTSGHFGLESARDPRFAGQLEREAQAARQGDPQAALQFMRMMTLGAAAETVPDAPGPQAAAKALRSPRKTPRASAPKAAARRKAAPAKPKSK
jgi:hypothetical protein